MQWMTHNHHRRGSRDGADTMPARKLMLLGGGGAVAIALLFPVLAAGSGGAASVVSSCNPRSRCATLRSISGSVDCMQAKGGGKR